MVTQPNNASAQATEGEKLASYRIPIYSCTELYIKVHLIAN